ESRRGSHRYPRPAALTRPTLRGVAAVLSLLTLNVQAASLPRAKLIMEWLDSRDDDLIILTETSNGTGTEFLLAQCRTAGLDVVHTKSSDGDRGCAIVGRVPVTAHPTLIPHVSLPGRAVAVRV